jgi:hypothetical protein
MREERQKGKQGQKSSGHSQSGREESKSGGSDSADLKEREYRDEKGEIHHHTKIYQEQHGL